MTTKPIKKYRALLRATVLDESRNRRTSQEICAIFQKRHRRAVATVTGALATAKIIKDIDDVRHVGRKTANPSQLELFDEKVADIIAFQVIEDGRKIRTERRALGSLTFDEVSIPRQSRGL